MSSTALCLLLAFSYLIPWVSFLLMRIMHHDCFLFNIPTVLVIALATCRGMLNSNLSEISSLQLTSHICRTSISHWAPPECRVRLQILVSLIRDDKSLCSSTDEEGTQVVTRYNCCSDHLNLH